MAALAGGCACGAVRFRILSDPIDAGWCHCRTCQLNSGCPAMAFASIPTTDYEVEQGADKFGRFASSDFAHREFCTACGTPLFLQEHNSPEQLDFSIATLDEPDRVRPGFHIFYTSRIEWAEACDGLPRYPRSRRNSEPMA
ncbi:GFA family protein [Sphingomonas sp. BIUV-7]|uniref:GFA family protein n=1 Tax=Sphingomonas natans TaxID=3063330 RepID=A0ABT8Y498_9SPHN|nr:GFA family protein [Sphingomonas sp. BIUV-7]MDO6413135.1 GFA family protein [Sphingomonas sp. BIUV-7]